MSMDTGLASSIACLAGHCWLPVNKVQTTIREMSDKITDCRLPHESTRPEPRGDSLDGLHLYDLSIRRRHDINYNHAIKKAAYETFVIDT